MTDATLGFYNGHAADYAAAGHVNRKLPSFLQRCRPGGRVLELGTGSGADAEAIIAAGFILDATDGSAELAALASRRLGRPVRTMLLDDLEAVGEYDGIYACASLTHVRRDDLGAILRRINRALVPGGVVWASFKSGTAEGTDDLGRYYSYLSAGELSTCWSANGAWSSINLEKWKGGGFDQRPTDWIAVIAVR